MNKEREETAIVLDFLPNGYPFDRTPSHRKLPIIQAIGKTRLVLLELVPRQGVAMMPNEEVYIGEGKRDKVHHILGRLALDKLTATAKAELDFVITDIIKQDEKRFVSYFNTAQPLTTRMHQLELLPGVGKKHMWEIVNQRTEKPFESFDDLKKRVKLMPDPLKTVVRRVVLELEGNQKHRIFVDA